MNEISNRKQQHLELAAKAESQSETTPGWEDVHLVPSSVPELELEDIDLSVDLHGHRLAAPFVIASMTGGHDTAIPINESLAIAAQEHGVAIGSGSQRAALRDPSLAKTFTVIRETAPNAVVMANIGVCQLVNQRGEQGLSLDEIETLVGMLEAQFLIVHLNVIEEAIQPEGDSNFAGLLDAMHRIADESAVPVIAKETGSGISREAARSLVEAGVAGLDVGGAGGTSFALIEGQRAESQGDRRGARLGRTFGGWGIPTVPSILEVRGLGASVIATGGVRSGLDAAKALTLGAAAAGVGRPILTAALEGPDAARNEMSILIDELRLAALLTGSRTTKDLAGLRPVLSGHTLNWATQRALL